MCRQRSRRAWPCRRLNRSEPPREQARELAVPPLIEWRWVGQGQQSQGFKDRLSTGAGGQRAIDCLLVAPFTAPEFLERARGTVRREPLEGFRPQSDHMAPLPVRRQELGEELAEPFLD